MARLVLCVSVMVRIALSLVAVLLAGCAAAITAGMSSWNRATAAAVDVLVEASATPPPSAHRGDPAAAVPPVVARYLQRALKDGYRPVRTVHAEQRATFFINGAWRELTASQHFSISPPGFVWDARIDIAPLIPARGFLISWARDAASSPTAAKCSDLLSLA